MLNLSLLLLSFAQATLNANVQDGETISAERTIRVTVNSEKPVTQVEFYVGEDLRDSDSSTPYEFKVDPLAEDDGDIKLVFKAYTEEGAAGSKSVSVKIDSGISKGADFHIAKAKEALTLSKWDEAILSGRVALRAKPGYNPARIVMARAYLGKGVYDKAQQLAEDALASEAGNTEASDILSAINLRKAFHTFSSAGDRRETLNSIGSALTSAVQARRKSLDARLDALGAITDANRTQYTDLALQTGRYKAAINAIEATANRTGEPSLMNRLAYAQMRAGMHKAALDTALRLQRERKIDAYGGALLAILQFQAGDTAGSDQAMKEALGNNANDPAVLTAQIFIAMSKGDAPRMGSLLTNAVKANSELLEIRHYLGILQHGRQQFADAEKSFEAVVMKEPVTADVYIERANQAFTMAVTRQSMSAADKAYQYLVAETYYRIALAARPDSPEALTGIALVYATQGKQDDAARYVQAAVAASPGYAPSAYAASMVYASTQTVLSGRAADMRKNDRDGVMDPDETAAYNKVVDQARQMGEDAIKMRELAGTLDKVNLAGRGTPKLADVTEYYFSHGRIALLPTPK